MNSKKSYLFVFLGVVLTAAAVSLFYLPNKIVSGGVSGLSTILYHSLGIQPGLSNAAINIFLLAVGLKILGKSFIVKTLVCSSLLSAFIQVFSFLPPVTDNILLATLFGSTLYGFGIGLALAYGASTGGTDILGRLIQHKFSHIPIGKVLMYVDGAVIVTSLIVFKNIELSLYGILALFVSTFSVDMLIRKLNVSKLAFVVSSKGEEIAEKLISKSTRGVTLLDAVGAYTHSGTKMLVCALKEHETPDFQRRILKIDKDAFIIFSESSQIVGNGFHVYK